MECKNDAYKEIFSLLKIIFNVLAYRGDFSDEQIEKLQLLIDEFCDIRRKYFPNLMTNYLDIFESGN